MERADEGYGPDPAQGGVMGDPGDDVGLLVQSLANRIVRRYARAMPRWADDLAGEARLAIWRAIHFHAARGEPTPSDDYLARCGLNAINRFVSQQRRRAKLSAEPLTHFDLLEWWGNVVSDEAGPIVRAMFREYLSSRDAADPAATGRACREKPPKDMTFEQRAALKRLATEEMAGATARQVADEFERRTGRKIHKSLVAMYRSGAVKGTQRPGRAKLSDQDLAVVLAERERGTPADVLAERFGVSKDTIWRAESGRSYRMAR